MNIALFLSSDGIALAHRQSAGHWAMIGETALNVPDLDASLAELRALAATREGDDFETLLVLPDDQILYTSLTAPTADRELTAIRIEDGLEGLTPYAVTELEYDWQVLEEGRVKIAVVAQETLEEARGFASTYGFASKGFAAMPPMERFPGVPTFGLGDEADSMGFTADGIAFGADTFGAPEADTPPEPEVEPEVEAEVEQVAAPETEAEAEVEPEAASTDETEPSSDETAETDAADEVEAAPAEPEPDVQSPPENTAPSAAEPEPREDDNAALAEALSISNGDPIPVAPENDAATPVQPIEDPSVSGPISSIPSEAELPTTSEASQPDAPQEVIGDAGPDDDTLPPAPSPASLTARQRARVIRGEPTGTDTGGGQFTAQRGPTSAPAGATARPLSAPTGSQGTPSSAPDNSRGSLVGQRGSRLGLSHPDGPSRAAPQASPPVAPPTSAPTTPATASATPAPAAPTPADGTQMPRLAEQLQRVRAASKARPAGSPGPAAVQPPRPRVEIDPRPSGGQTGATAERRPSPFEAPAPSESTTSGRKGRLAGMLKRGGSAAPAAAPAAQPEETAPKPAPSRKGLRRRKSKGAAAAAAATTDGGTATVPAEDQTFATGLLVRKSVKQTGGSFKTGLILTIILLLVLALVAIWAALFLPNSTVARFFGLGSEPQQVAATSGLPAPDVDAATPLIAAPTIVEDEPTLADEAAADGIDIAPDTGDPEFVAATAPEQEEVAVLPDIDADLDLPPLPEIDQGQNPTVEEAEALYAEDGIWARSPERPDLRPFDLLDRVYTASIDPEVSAFDAVALPNPGVNPGEILRRFPPPPAFGTEFNLTDQGLISPTPDGVLTPEGAFVISGVPALVALQRPREIAAAAPEIDVQDAVLAAFRPTERPNDLAETRERQVLNGLTQVELSERRPAERPTSPQEAAANASLFPGDGDGADPDAVNSAVEQALAGTELAVARSLLPRSRPGNIAQIVASAERIPTPSPTVVAVAPSAVSAGPRIPSNADVSRAATERNVIRLRNVNLIGVSGSSSDRRALVRLSSGRFVRVTVGDRLDGGRVAAIGETTLQYVRSGRTVTLEIPG